MGGLRNGTRSGPARPEVERLEERSLPTVSLVGSTLTISGNNIVIQDSGSNSASSTAAVMVSTDSGSGTFAGNQVSVITINGNSGGDNVAYFLGGNSEQLASGKGPALLTARGGRTVNVNLDPSQHDNFLLVLTSNQTFVGANYTFNVNENAAAAGATQAGVNLFVVANGLTIDNTSSLSINLNGGTGNDQLVANLNNVDVGPASSPGFTGETGGGAGSSLLSITADGNGGSDQVLVAEGLTADSQGGVFGSVNGGSKKSVAALLANIAVPPPGATFTTGTNPFLTLSNAGTGIVSLIPFVFTSNVKQQVTVV
jgi:hypothetical protein